jgi:hypothetical protein
MLARLQPSLVIIGRACARYERSIGINSHCEAGTQLMLVALRMYTSTPVRGFVAIRRCLHSRIVRPKLTQINSLLATLHE